MRKHLLVAFTAMATLGMAQSPLTTLAGGTNQGNVGGGLYFDLQVNTTVTFTQIDFRCGATTVAGSGSLDIFIGPSTYDGNVTNATLWTYVATVSAAVAPSIVASGPVVPAFALAPGSYGVALKSNAFSHGYTNGVGCSSNTIPGSCTNSSFSTAELTLRAGAAQNAFLTGGIFTPRIFNGAIHYTPGGNPIRVAAWESYGQGCYAWYRSFYQLFPNPAGLNLGTPNAVTALRLSHQGGYYSVTASNTPVVPPTSPPITLTSADGTFLATSAFSSGVLPFPIPHPLNGNVGQANDLEISSDGYIVPAPATMPNANNPSVAGFLNGAPRWAPHWKNMNPLNAVSSMHVEQDLASGALLVTWNNVADAGFTTTSTFQVAFYPIGDVEYRYGAMSVNGGGGLPVIIGWTEGAGALDPGNFEIVTSLPFDTETQDNRPVGFSLVGRPVLGQSVGMLIDTIPTGTQLGAVMLGFTQHNPGIDLSGLGMPECALYLTGDAAVSFAISGASYTFPLQIPNLTVLNGGQLFGQAVSISAGYNALGVLTSNGLLMRLGTL